MTKLQPPPPEPVWFYDAVGRVAVSSAGLDIVLAQLLDALLDSRVSGHITRGLSTDQLIRHLQAVIPRVIVHDRDRIAALVARLESLRQARNHIIHAHWTLPTSGLLTDDEANEFLGDPEDPPLIALKPRLRNADLPRPFTLDALIRLARDLEQAANEAWILAFNVRRQRRGHDPVDVKGFMPRSTHQ